MSSSMSANFGEMPAHAVASLDQSEKIFDAERENHHGVRFRLRDVCDGVVFEELRGEFDVVEFDFRGQGEALVIGKVGNMDAKLFQLLVDSHCAEDCGSGLDRRVFEQGDFLCAGVEEEPRGFDDEFRVHARNIIRAPPCEQIRFEHDAFVRDSAESVDLPRENAAERGLQMFRRVVRTVCVVNRSWHGKPQKCGMKKDGPRFARTRP